jgi:hypothetical protein
MPTDVADSSRAAQQTVDHELSSEMFSQGIAGAIVLAIIYVITQALGFFQAFGSSFIGDGKNAYRQTFGHTSFQSYQAKHIKPALDRGNMRLTELRSHLGREVPKYREDVSKVSCSDYYRRKVEEETAHTSRSPYATNRCRSCIPCCWATRATVLSTGIRQCRTGGRSTPALQRRRTNRGTYSR